MDTTPKKPRPERVETDTSLRAERMKSDLAMALRREGVEEGEDAVVERAREQADAVLDLARDKADLRLETSSPGVGRPTGEIRAVAQERAVEDEVIQDQRDVADEALRRQREDEGRILSALLPLEREKTDRYLLTERIRSDDALAQRDDFLGMVSHDLRNLLSGIVLNASVLSEDALDSEEGRRSAAGMKRIQRYAARMNRLIGDLVDVASIDAGQLAVHRSRRDAVLLLTEAVDAFAQAASEKGIALESGTVERTLPGNFDHDRILQVLANLITNALKFTPRGGRLVVRGDCDADGLRFSVSDTGPGIPGDMLEAVFERFWQVGKNDRRGLGLGLYISKCIVDAHGGRIWVESTLGEGSAFHFTIPRAVPAAGSASLRQVR